MNGSYFNFSVPEPTGVVGVIAPEESSLLGLVSRLAPIIVSGNAAVVLASETRPLPAVTLTEVLATSDVPGGVVNLITGLRRELVAHLAGAHGRERPGRLRPRPGPGRRRRGAGRRERQAARPAPGRWQRTRSTGSTSAASRPT